MEHRIDLAIYTPRTDVPRNKKDIGQAEVKEETRDYLGHKETETTETYIYAAEELRWENICREYGGFDLDI